MSWTLAGLQPEALEVSLLGVVVGQCPDLVVSAARRCDSDVL